MIHESAEVVRLIYKTIELLLILQVMTIKAKSHAHVVFLDSNTGFILSQVTALLVSLAYCKWPLSVWASTIIKFKDAPRGAVALKILPFVTVA